MPIEKLILRGFPPRADANSFFPGLTLKVYLQLHVANIMTREILTRFGF